MAGWIELREEYDLVESDGEISGTRAFVGMSTGADSLPAIGDSFVTFDNTTITACTARKRKRRVFWYERGAVNALKEKVIVTYSTRSETSPFTTADTDERKYQLGGEILSIEDPSANWTWDTAGTPVEQPLFKSNVMGSFTRQVVFASDAAKATAVALWESQMGTINTAEFEDHRIGSVLFDGADGGTQYDSTGTKQWVFRLQFTFRIIRDETQVITQDDWLYLWNKSASGSGEGAWDKPKDANGKFLYKKTDFTALF